MGAYSMGGFSVDYELQKEFKETCKMLGEDHNVLLANFMKDVISEYGFDIALEKKQAQLKVINADIANLLEKKEKFNKERRAWLLAVCREDVYHWTPGETGDRHQYTKPNDTWAVTRFKFLREKTKLTVEEICRVYEKEIDKMQDVDEDYIDACKSAMRAGRDVIIRHDKQEKNQRRLRV